jgi:hypothetical protein
VGRPFVQVGIGELPIRMISSILADEKSAYQLANLVNARWGDDSAWESPTVIVRHQLLSPAERADVAALEPGDELVTGGMGVAPGTPGAGRWRVEGWQETWDRGDGDGAILRVQQFAVSDALRWRTDPGQLTRTTIQLLTPGPYLYATAGVPLSVRFDVVPADNQPPERPMTDGTFSILVDGAVVYQQKFAGSATTVQITPLLDVGEHTVTARYDGVWGIWNDSEASVPVTVTPGTPTLVFTLTPTGPIGVVPLAYVAGTPAGGFVNIQMAEQGAPDDWMGTQINLDAGWAIPLAGLDRPLRFRAVYTPHSPNWLAATSNVVGFGWSWQLVADQHPTWQDVADTRTDWADVAARG